MGADNACVMGHMANDVVMCEDIRLAAVMQTASISGTVRASGTNEPVAGVKVEINRGDGWTFPINWNARTASGDSIYLTGADGTYTVEFEAKAHGESASVRVSKAGMNFVPESLSGPAGPGSAITGLDFTGFVYATITGRVVAPGGTGPFRCGGPLGGRRHYGDEAGQRC